MGNNKLEKEKRYDFRHSAGPRPGQPGDDSVISMAMKV